MGSELPLSQANANTLLVIVKRTVSAACSWVPLHRAQLAFAVHCTGHTLALLMEQGEAGCTSPCAVKQLAKGCLQCPHCTIAVIEGDQCLGARRSRAWRVSCHSCCTSASKEWPQRQQASPMWAQQAAS